MVLPASKIGEIYIDVNNEAWSEARYFSAAKMAELHDEQKPEPAEPPSAERREQALAFARQAIEASLALADRMEAA